MDISFLHPLSLDSVTDLTNDYEDEEQGGNACRDVKHGSDVVSQLVHVIHIGHQDGRHQEPDGDAQLEENNIYSIKIDRPIDLCEIEIV